MLKETFLEVKKIAKKRDVEITEIDLRTGITKEQEQSGQIVKICLDEIDVLTPLFSFWVCWVIVMGGMNGIYIQIKIHWIVHNIVGLKSI
ncbi:hypothetical protein MNB_SV-14-1319 [hydrothermal vent metagenome]|uniref:Uncharacterized protein n=1 Tax=hydrothermal vent metagenome TaxID=652676 RepID=A0A1W1BWD6_9ZZZZ